MFKRLLALLVITTVLFSVLTVRAQDASETCTADTLTTLLDDLTAANDAAQTAIAAGDLTGAIDGLAAVHLQVAAMQAACNNLSFSGDTLSVIGPVTIPEGTYRVIVTTDGYFAAYVTAVDGECGKKTSLLNISEGEANKGAEALLTSEGCSAIIETKNVSADWTLVFEKLG